MGIMTNNAVECREYRESTGMYIEACENLQQNAKELGDESINLLNKYKELYKENYQLNSKLNMKNNDIENLKIRLNATKAMYKNQINNKKIIIRPTYQEVLSFLASDHTNLNIYKYSYDCTEFSNELIANARDNGLFACTAELGYLDKQGHVIVAFNTIDRGLIYVEPQNNNIMTKDFVVGVEYWNNKIVKISSCWGVEVN